MIKENKKDEGELIQLVQQGDEQAFQELYERYKNLVYFVAFKMCRNDADAQDVVQESFIEIQRSIKNLQKPSYFKLWLYRIVDSKCKKLFRKNKFAQSELESVEYGLAEERKDYIPKKKQRFQNDNEILNAFIDELPKDQRMAVILFYMEQLTSAEISMVCDVSEGTIKSRLFTARNTLRTKVSSYERQEGVALDFQDFSATITAALVSQFAMSIKAPQVSNVKNIKMKSNVSNLLKANALAVKATLALCATAFVATGGYALYEHTRKPAKDESVERSVQSTFPATIFKNETITSSKDAYYAMKMNFSIQDLADISPQDRQELDKLYTVLKEENGIYFQKLKQSNWVRELEK